MNKKRKPFNDRELQYVKTQLLEITVHGSNNVRYIPEPLAFCEYLRPELHYDIAPKSLYKIAAQFEILISLTYPPAPPVQKLVQQKKLFVEDNQVVVKPDLHQVNQRFTFIENQLKMQEQINRDVAKLHIQSIQKINELVALLKARNELDPEFLQQCESSHSSTKKVFAS